MKYSLVALFALFVPCAVHAQTFSNGSLALDGSNVENVGAVFEAIDFTGGDSFPTLTLNGVTFIQVGGGGGLSGTNFSLNNGGTDGGRAGGVTTSDAVYDLVNDGTYNNSDANRDQTLQITGLTSGQSYSVQLFFDTGAGDDRSVSVTDGTQTSAVADANNSLSTPTGPVFVTDVFTAGSSGIESLTLNTPAFSGIGGTSSAGNEPLQFSGFVVESVPEPSTYALLGLGLLATMGFAARKRLA